MIEKLKWNDATKKMPPDESVVLLWVRFPRPFAGLFWTLGYVKDGIWRLAVHSKTFYRYSFSFPGLFVAILRQ